jgi:cysteine desulfurase
MAALRDRLEAGLTAIAPQLVIFGAGVPRLSNTTLFAVPGVKAETAVIAFDLNGIALSSGSACSSGRVQPSAVLAAMGVEPELARGALRASLGWTTTENDIERLLNAWRNVVSSLLKNRTHEGIAA